jgi:hypothetical protein
LNLVCFSDVLGTINGATRADAPWACPIDIKIELLPSLSYLLTFYSSL